MSLLNLFKAVGRGTIDTILHTSSIVKIMILLLLVLLLSSLNSLESLQSLYFGDKKNFVNIYFAKLGWGWTLLCIFPVSIITSSLYSDFNLKMTLRHLSRIGIAHCIFLVVTSVIVTSNSSVSLGSCSNTQYKNKVDCVSNIETWIELDISGHTFLLAYCIFVMTEECKTIKHCIWSSFPNILAKCDSNKPEEHTNSISIKNRSICVNFHTFVTPVIKLLEILACIVMLLMGNVFIATQLYHHTFIEKVLGFLLAVFCYSMTYGVLYGSFRYGPCAIKEGSVNPLI